MGLHDSSKKRKVAINPCAGVGKLMGGICRQAAYKVVDELKPNITELVCMPALAARVQEDIDFIKDYPVLVINGCSLKCGTKVVVDQGEVVAKEIYAPRVIAGKVNLRNESRSEHGPQARLAADLIARRVAEEVDFLLDRPDLSGKPDFSDRPDVSGKPDFSDKPDVSETPGLPASPESASA